MAAYQSRPARARAGSRVLKRVVSLAAAALATLAFAPSALAAAGDTERVSVDGAGNQANDNAGDPVVSADGRYVAFSSLATNLVPGGSNGNEQVFVHDRQTGTTEQISVNSAGNQANSDSFGPAISADGRYVAFVSDASNLVAGDTNNRFDTFVHDRQAATTERVSVDSAGNEGIGPSGDVGGIPAISADGRFVAFTSNEQNLVPGDTNDRADVFVHDRQAGTTERVSVDSAGNQLDLLSVGPAISADGLVVAFISGSGPATDVFVRDRQAGTTERVSVDSAGNQGNSSSAGGSISADGRFVAFSSDSSNLVSGDTNGRTDVFVRDRQAGTTERVSVNSAGNQASGGDSLRPAISADGRFVVFHSGATNLVGSDTNGAIDVFIHNVQTGTTQRVSVDSAGNEGNAVSDRPSIDADGGFVAFESPASNLVADDTNDTYDIFVHERGPSVDSASQDAPAAGTVSTNTSTSPDDPVGASVTTPLAGTVTIDEVAATTPDPSGYSLLGQEVQITAPSASAADPLVLEFRLHASVLPPGADETNAQAFRDGAPIADCDAGAGSSAAPDPCVATRTATPGGGVELTVRTSQASTWNFGVTADATPPETTIDSGPSGPTNDASPSFGFSSDDPGAGFECRLDSNQEADFQPCSSPQSYSSLTDGLHTFEVRATNTAGTDPTPASRSFTVDTAAPETAIDSGPSGPTNQASPSFSFSSEPGTSFECRLDSAQEADFQPCSSPQSYSSLTDGLHTFEVRATDSVGNTDPTPASRSFTVDTAAPETAIDSGPSGPTNQASPSFSFSSEPGTSFECRLDSAQEADFQPCSSPQSYSSLTDGSHTFEVRATDSVGNTDPTPSSRSFTVDTTAPQTQIAGPSGPIHDPTPSFGFFSEAGASFKCKVDSGAYVACTSPTTTRHLTDGSHAFYVRATDSVGNTDSTPAQRMFTVRTAAVSVSGSTLVVTAAAGAKDNFAVTHPSGPNLRVTDTPGAIYTGSGVHTGAGCTRSGDYSANCHASGISLIKISSGDQNDKVVIPAAIKSSLDGGAANDALQGSPKDDTLTGGPGADSLKGMNGNDQLLTRDNTDDTTINCDGGAHAGAADKASSTPRPTTPQPPAVRSRRARARMWRWVTRSRTGTYPRANPRQPASFDAFTATIKRSSTQTSSSTRRRMAPRPRRCEMTGSSRPASQTSTPPRTPKP